MVPKIGNKVPLDFTCYVMCDNEAIILYDEAACLRSPAGGRGIPELSGVRRQQALVRGGLHWEEVSLPLPACEGEPRNAGHGEGVATAQSAEHQHGGGLLCGVAGSQTGHRERQVHR